MSSAASVDDPHLLAWLRGLLSIALADDDFESHEQDLLCALTQEILGHPCDLQALGSISPTDLATALGEDAVRRENFLRTAVMVALADGVYTQTEATLLRQFAAALSMKTDVIDALEHTRCDREAPALDSGAATVDLLAPVRHWLDDLHVHEPRLAHFLVKLIPAQCPFERDIVLFGHKLVHIPPLCKLNPLYEQLVSLRFRALCYLADDCGEDISAYCSAGSTESASSIL